MCFLCCNNILCFSTPSPNKVDILFTLGIIGVIFIIFLEMLASYRYINFIVIICIAIILVIFSMIFAEHINYLCNKDDSNHDPSNNAIILTRRLIRHPYFGI